MPCPDEYKHHVDIQDVEVSVITSTAHSINEQPNTSSSGYVVPQQKGAMMQGTANGEGLSSLVIHSVRCV